MSRVQLALNVDDLAESIAFYTKLFGTGPAKQRPGYANFAIAEPPLKLILMENPGEAGLASVEERDTTCCYARQDKFWVKGAPSGERWEIYTVLADSATFWGQDGAGGEDDASADVCCA